MVVACSCVSAVEAPVTLWSLETLPRVPWVQPLPGLEPQAVGVLPHRALVAVVTAPAGQAAVQAPPTQSTPYSALPVP